MKTICNILANVSDMLLFSCSSILLHKTFHLFIVSQNPLSLVKSVVCMPWGLIYLFINLKAKTLFMKSIQSAKK